MDQTGSIETSLNTSSDEENYIESEDENLEVEDSQIMDSGNSEMFDDVTEAIIEVFDLVDQVCIFNSSSQKS